MVAPNERKGYPDSGQDTVTCAAVSGTAYCLVAVTLSALS
jgi:hypothetical protein